MIMKEPTDGFIVTICPKQYCTGKSSVYINIHAIGPVLYRIGKNPQRICPSQALRYLYIFSRSREMRRFATGSV